MSSPRNDYLQGFIRRLATSVALLVALSIPLGYWLTGYYNLSESLDFKAQVKARVLTDLVSNSPQLWRFSENRIQGLIYREPVTLKNEFVEVFDQRNVLITTAGHEPAWPFIERSYPLYDGDRVAGALNVSESLHELLVETLAAAIFGIWLGALVLIALRFVPLRVLRRLSDELFEEKERAEITLQSIGDAIVTVDSDQRIVYINPVGESMLGMRLPELAGKPFSDFFQFQDGSSGLPISSALKRAMDQQALASCEGRSVLPAANGLRIAVEERASPIFSSEGVLVGGVLCLRDVSIAREYLQRRSWEASHDLLTGLVNRREFEDRINTALTNAQITGQRFVLCYMDLDRFKVVNDTCGHAAGDELLIQLTSMMQSRVRDTDTLARLGGDEFGLLLDGCDVDRGQLIASDLLTAVADFQFHFDAQLFTVGMSVGLTSITGDNFSVTEVLGEADSACYWAKEQGRNRVCVYQASDMDLAARRSETGWVSRINSALADNRFVLYHQTYRTLSKAGGSRRHLEILLRMVDEAGEIVAPGRFLPAAERYNLMPNIDRWVIHAVFSEFRHIAMRYPDAPLMVNINLSGASINSLNLLDYVSEQMHTHGVDPHSVCFEVTETVAVKHLQAAIDFIQACRAMGFSFALDDFGTGTSSFGYLKNLPVDYLKIDGSFVRNLQHDSVDKAMTETINRIGHLMGKLTVAEFAESESVVEALREMGVDFAQGYGVFRPEPLFSTPLFQKDLF